MTRETMRAQMEKEMGDVLWERVAEGKMSRKECNRLCNILADIFDFPDLRSYRRGKFKLKADIQRRLRELRRTPTPNIPGDKPIQEITKPVIGRYKSTTFKF